MNAKELFYECRENGVPLSVMNVSGSAADNAADTIGSRFVRGNFDDEFISIWIESVRGLLCCEDSAEQEARDWFADRGLTW